MRLFVLVALLGALVVAYGVNLWDRPAGIVVGGLELIAGAYAGAYLAVRRPAE